MDMLVVRRYEALHLATTTVCDNEFALQVFTGIPKDSPMDFRPLSCFLWNFPDWNRIKAFSENAKAHFTVPRRSNEIGQNT